ncbi:hypothetical protein HWV03_11080 [Moritella sp. 36]|uniref:hypothetical protein n=1 Tax=Moritella sp. 36 TaxID=2746233 RepID=UPI001BA9BFBA|nr:hypothetical protein [Moritella sp. 36]QUM89307.1 hypothetical protein HWV03_11080 [Moritella sp. 36]
MSSKDTNLSNYGFDMMVATTQKSINANLKRYLKHIESEPKYFCFVYSKELQHAVLKPLDEIIAESGVNPFELPDDIDIDDSKIEALTKKSMFIGGIKMVPGLPDMDPGDIPDMVEIYIDNSATVSCNLLFSEFKLVEIVDGGRYGEDRVEINSQGMNEAWRLITTVNLETMNIDPSLNTAYFNKRPKQQKAILDKINQLESGTFSLEQLYLNLTNAKYQKIDGVEGISPLMELYIKKYAQDHYNTTLENNGYPVISLSASDNRHQASLKITGIQRTGLKYFDEETHLPVINPTPAQKALSTFNYMCVTGDHALPMAVPVNWNWIEESDEQDNGVIAISRQTITNFYKDLILSAVGHSMVRPWARVTCHPDRFGNVTFNWGLVGNEKPTEIQTPATGSELLVIKYSGSDSDEDSSFINDVAPFITNYGRLTIKSDYECRLSVSGNIVTVVQNISMYVSVRHMDAEGKGTIINKTITEEHALYAGHSGQIQVTHSSKTENNPDDINFEEAWYSFGNVSNLVKDIKKQAEQLVDTYIKEIPTKTFENFVFPGGDVFSYKNVKFSDNQDLVSNINYQTVSEEQEFEDEGTTSVGNSQEHCHCEHSNRNIAALVD